MVTIQGINITIEFSCYKHRAKCNYRRVHQLQLSNRGKMLRERYPTHTKGKQEAHQLVVERAKYRATKIRPKSRPFFELP